MDKMGLHPIDYACKSIETMMRKYKAEELPPIGRFHYHQGVFLSGVYRTYLECGEERYFQFMKDWVDSVIDEKGEIHTFDSGLLDDMQPGVLLYPLFEKTGDKRYRKALETLMPIIRDFPRNKEGGFCHKADLPDQMWLDGLYMAGPVSVEYAYKFEQPEYMELAIEQALLMQEKTMDENTGLWHHAWDSSRKAEWADPETGLSPEFWGRSIGWVPVAVLDELDFIPQSHPKYGELCSLVRNLLAAVCRCQTCDGRWYQIVDKEGQKGNWLETSCTCLYVAALCKAVGKGILPRAYLENAARGYKAVIRSLLWEEENLLIKGVCIGTGVGDYQHYCERPTATNDLHGVGAFLLMCVEAHRQGIM